LERQALGGGNTGAQRRRRSVPSSERWRPARPATP